MEGPYQVCEPLTPEEYDALKASIEEHGVRVPIEVDEEGNILDGHNRAAIARALQIPCPTTVKSGLENDNAKRMYARELNCARRQMTPDKKKKVVEAQLTDMPELSNRWIAAITGVEDTTVADARDRLERTAVIPQLEEFKGKDGKMRPAKRDKPPRFPWMNDPGWQNWHRDEARHYLRQMSEDEKDTLSAMIQSFSPSPGPVSSVKLLAEMVQLSAAQRQRVLDLWASEDEADREKAVRIANGERSPIDPRITMFEGASGYLMQSIRARPKAIDVEEIKSANQLIRSLILNATKRNEEE